MIHIRFDKIGSSSCIFNFCLHLIRYWLQWLWQYTEYIIALVLEHIVQRIFSHTLRFIVVMIWWKNWPDMNDKQSVTTGQYKHTTRHSHFWHPDPKQETIPDRTPLGNKRRKRGIKHVNQTNIIWVDTQRTSDHMYTSHHWRNNLSFAQNSFYQK